MDIITIDFETAYDSKYSLPKMSTVAYVRDPRFQTIGVGVRFANVDSYRWFEEAAFIEWARTVDWTNTAVLAHNTHFDAFILSEIYGIYPMFYLCTQAMGRALHGVLSGTSLEKMSTRYGVGVKGKEVLKAIGKWRKDFTQAEWLTYGDYCTQDCRLCWGLFERMVQVYPYEELRLNDAVIRMFVRPKLRLDEKMVLDFHAKEVARKQELLDIIGQDKDILMSNDKFAELLIVLGVEPPMKVSEATGKSTWAFSQKDVEFKALLDHEDEVVRAVMQARFGVKSTINETRALRMLDLGRDGAPVPVYYKISGAHTHRLSGGDKSNMANLERVNEKKGKGVLRKAIIAPPDHEIIAGDSAQIEARTVAWLAEEWSIVNAFERGDDVYSLQASVIYGRKIEGKTNPEDKGARDVGKIVTLALGYGMGLAKFASSMQVGVMGMDPIIFRAKDAQTIGVDVNKFMTRKDLDKVLSSIATTMSREDLTVHVAVCDHILRTYRANNQNITRLWWETCPRLIDAMYKGEQVSLRGCLYTEKNALVLPSGLKLQYDELSVSYTPDGRQEASYFNGKWRTGLYGGLLTENICQALARCVVMEQMMATVDLDYTPVFTTYDEIVLCEHTSVAAQAEQDLKEIMCSTPAWATGLPLAADVGRAYRYGDA